MKWRPITSAPKDKPIVIFRTGTWRWGCPRIAKFYRGQWWTGDDPIKSMHENEADYVWQPTPKLPAMTELELQVERFAEVNRQLCK